MLFIRCGTAHFFVGTNRRPGQGSEGREVTARTRTVRRVPIEVSVERYRRVLAKKSSQAVAASLRLLSEHLTNRRNSQKHSTFTVNLRSGPVLELLRACRDYWRTNPAFPSAGGSSNLVPERAAPVPGGSFQTIRVPQEVAYRKIARCARDSKLTAANRLGRCS